MIQDIFKNISERFAETKFWNTSFRQIQSSSQLLPTLQSVRYKSIEQNFHNQPLKYTLKEKGSERVSENK